MNKSSLQDTQPPNNQRKPLWLKVLRRGGIGLGVMLSVGLGVGTWRLRTFIQEDLAPLAQKSLTTTLNRPVKIGKVTDFSLLGVRFAASAIPATSTDADKVTMDAVEVGFDFWQLLFQSRLKLDVTLVNPDVYIQQDAQGSWVSTTLAPPGGGGAIKTDLDNLRIRNGKLVLVPHQVSKPQKITPPSASTSVTPSATKSVATSAATSAAPIEFSQLNGSAQLRQNNQLIMFQVGGKSGKGGNINLWGEVRPKNLAASVQVQTEDLFAPQVSQLVPLPINLQAGRATGNLKIQSIPQQPILLFGKLAIQGVTMAIPQAPQTFNQAKGNVSFKGMEMKLENVTANYGKIPLVANGIIDRRTGYQLVGKVKAVNLPQALNTLQVKSPIPVTGKVKGDVRVGGAMDKPIISGKVTTIKPARIDKVDFHNIGGKFDYFTSTGLISIRDIQGKAKLGGEVTGGGILQLGQNPNLNFRLLGKNLPGDSLAQTYNTQPPLQIGNLAATAVLTGTPTNFQTFVKWQAPQATYPGQGETIIYPDKTVAFRNVELAMAGGKVVAAGTWDNQNWYTVAQAAGVELEPFVAPEQLQNISLNGANFNGRVIASGSSAPFKINKIDTQQGEVKIAGGKVAISEIRWGDKNFAAQLVANGVRLGQILQDSHPALANPLTGKFQIVGSQDNFSPKTLQGKGNAILDIGGGTVAVNNIQLASGLYKAQLNVNQVPLQQLSPVPELFWGKVVGKFNVAGSVDSFQLADIQATGEAKLNVAGGTAIANNIQLNNGRYQAAVTAKGLTAEKFNQQLRGKLDSKFQATGTVDNFNLANMRAVGEASLSQGITVIKQPLSAVLGWTGEKLIIERTTSPGLQASGYLLAKVQDVDVPEITDLNLNVALKNYNLQQLLLNLPQGMTLTGKTDFSGKITGQPATPNVQGQLALENLKVNEWEFESKLAGKMESNPGGLNLDVTGSRDKIALNLDPNGNARDFGITWKDTVATGKTQGDKLAVKLKDIPLEEIGIKLPENPLVTGVLMGKLTGDLLINQQTWATSGELAIANPEIGTIKGDLLSAKFNYANGTTILSNSELIKGNSKYAFAGNITQASPIPKIKGKATVEKGKIEDILTALQLFEIQDLQRGMAQPNYGTAEDLKTQAVGMPELPVLTQIQRFYEILALLEKQQSKRQESQLIPLLADLTGTFNGEVAVDTTKDIAVDFNLNGEKFAWGDKNFGPTYNADTVVAAGSFKNGDLRLLPLLIKSEKSQIKFSGNVGGEQQNGTLEVDHFPLQVLSKYINLPISIAGDLTTRAALSGSIANPQAIGTISITDGAINQKPVQSANASFNYTDGRLSLSSTVKVRETEPLSIVGGIPYALPFAATVPDSNEIDLKIKVKNEGLALLNLFTDQIAFENGQGEVDIQVGGTLDAPQLNGIATLNDATFSARTLPGNLTQVAGKINFDFDRIIVKNFQSNYSQGQVTAQGQIPITRNLPTQIDNPLTVSLEQLLLNLKGLYQGNASGKLQITGAVLKPTLSGNINLTNGRVVLSETTDGSQTQANVQQVKQIEQNIERIKVSKQNNPEVDNAIVRFEDLNLDLGKNIEINRPASFNFLATGSLNLNGSLGNPLADGTIQLTKGSVNLFTTQLKLTNGYKHQAIFTKDEGLNPYLDIRLFAKVLDVIQSTDFNKADTSGLAALETVRVEASVQGPSDTLNENLTLTSTPARTETEIVALLGSGIGQNQQANDSTLALINIAGSAVFNNFQRSFNQIGTAFGLSEFRIFPTVITENPRAGRRSNSSLELAAEAGVDITDEISASTIKILTTDDPIQWGVNYRINNIFRLRGSTNFLDDSRAVFEYQRRF
ncbi:MAG: translocation/assembly module TamB domain-containing protein [Calothrix sp. MO_167.B42]|nr:translocation/assembly module TamB domain-containing protein [Calothrix sp. MO_167.B42]